jgi:polar amino acid transport system permease protein
MDTFFETVTIVAKGVPLTLGVTVASLLLGAVLAVPLALGLETGRWWIRRPIRLIVDVVRAVPILVWLFIVYFGIHINGAPVDELTASVVTLGGVTAAYLSEVYRASVAAVPQGQWDAAQAVGLHKPATVLWIIAPQAVSIALPSTTTFALTLLKDSSIPSVIGVTEVTFRTVAQVREQGDGLAPFLAALIIYIGLSVPVAVASRGLDHTLRKRVGR